MGDCSEDPFEDDKDFSNENSVVTFRLIKEKEPFMIIQETNFPSKIR